MKFGKKALMALLRAWYVLTDWIRSTLSPPEDDGAPIVPITDGDLRFGTYYLCAAMEDGVRLAVKERLMTSLIRTAKVRAGEGALLPNMRGVELLDLETSESDFYYLALLGLELNMRENLARVFRATPKARKILHGLVERQNVLGYFNLLNRERIGDQEKDLISKNLFLPVLTNVVSGSGVPMRHTKLIAPLSTTELVRRKTYFSMIITEGAFIGMEEFLLVDVMPSGEMRIARRGPGEKLWWPEIRSMKYAGLIPAKRHNLNRVFPVTDESRVVLGEITRYSDLDRYIALIGHTLSATEKSAMQERSLTSRRWAQWINKQPPERG